MHRAGVHTNCNTKYQNPQREKVNEWLSDINESSLSPPDIIKISNDRGKIVEMYQLPNKETQSHTPSPKEKGKEQARQSDEQAALMADLTQAICQSLDGTSPKLDQVIDDALGRNVWFDKFKKAQSTYRGKGEIKLDLNQVSNAYHGFVHHNLR